MLDNILSYYASIFLHIRTNVLIKDHYLKYYMRPSDNLIVHIGVVYHRYLDLEVSHIFLTRIEITYTLLISMSDY